MDPISQGTVGALLPQSILSKRHLGWFTLCGVCAGLAPDLDIFINSSEDPLLFLTYHRQFTHSLIFIPFGALFVASALWLLIRKKLSFSQIYVACLLGYATHGLLDSCTTYGTQLFWPFSNYRVAWNNISIVDPLFTIPLLSAVIATAWTKKQWIAVAAIVWAITYLSLGLLQNHRAERALWEIAQNQGHEPKELSVKASFANILLWKGIYEYEGTFYVNAIRTGLGSNVTTCGEPSSLPKLDIEKHFPWLTDSQQLVDVHRFKWFSQGYVGIDANNLNRIIDIRYSILPNRIDGFWGIELDRQLSQDEHVLYAANERVEPGATEIFLDYLQGTNCRPIEVPI